MQQHSVREDLWEKVQTGTAYSECMGFGHWACSVAPPGKPLGVSENPLETDSGSGSVLRLHLRVREERGHTNGDLVRAAGDRGPGNGPRAEDLRARAQPVARLFLHKEMHLKGSAFASCQTVATT